MARIRTIKPDFFRDEDLQDLEAANPGAYAMLAFAGLWGHCDRNGVFEWKPRTLKLDILPFLEFDLSETLTLLAEAGFIERYEVDGKHYGRVRTFLEHQRIGGKEASEAAKYPQPDNTGSDGEAPGKKWGSDGEAIGIAGREGKGRERKGREQGAPDGARVVGLDENAWTRWLTYRREIRKPLKPASIPAAQQALAAFGTDQSAVVEQSIAQGWQGLFPVKHAGANGSAAPEAARAWDRLIASNGDERSGATAKALEAIGGWPRVRMRTEFETPKLRAEFCRAYSAASAG